MSLKFYKVIAGTLSLISVFILLLAPLLIYAFVTDMSMDDKSPLPDWLGWFILLGGVLGAALLRPINHLIICKIGGFPKSSLNLKW